MNNRLKEQPLNGNTFIYALQWLCINLIVCLVLPLVVAPYIGLDEEGLRQLTQRTFFYTGLATLLQVFWGHRLPIYEGPSTMWVSAMIALGSSAIQSAKPLSLLRSEITLGLVAAGIIYILLAGMKMMGRMVKLFNPAIMGTFFMLIVIQLSKTVVGNLISLSATLTFNWVNCAVGLITLITAYVISLRGSGFIKSVALLIGALSGWLVYLAAAMSGLCTYRIADIGNLPLFEPVGFLPWGTPAFDPVVLVTAVIIAFMVLANLSATVKGMGDLLGQPNPDMDKAVAITGVAHLIGGLSGTLGYVPQSHCIGFVGITGIASRAPLVLHAVFLMVMGLLPALGALFTSMPPAVGHAVLIVILVQLFTLGLSHYASIEMNQRNSLVIGIPLIIGAGVMFLPASLLAALPVMLSGFAGNGLLVGLLLCLALDNIIKKSAGGNLNEDY
ncbi:MAG: purine/pyrimidine permease [Bacillota bacterium]